MSSRRSVAFFTAACLLTAAAARGDFITVINTPPDVIPPGGILGADTQINLLPGTVSIPGEVIYLGGFNMPAENAQLNVLGGAAWSVQAWTGSELNVIAGSINAANLLGGRGTMSGGFVNSWVLFAEGRLEMSGGFAANISTAGLTDGAAPDVSYFVMNGGKVGVLDAVGNVSVRGGVVESMSFLGAGFVDISGGAIGEDFEVGQILAGVLPDDPMREIVIGSGGQVRMRGGSIGHRMILRGGRTLDYSGGVIGDAFQAFEDSHVTIRGSHFLVDGVELTWPAGKEFVVTQRDVALEGLLADGSSFRFDLYSEPGRGDYFSQEAMISLMLIPEPRSGIAVLMLTLAIAVTCRIRA